MLFVIICNIKLVIYKIKKYANNNQQDTKIDHNKEIPRKSNEPTFKPIFGKNWDSLPPVMHKHYANRSFSDDVYSVKGEMEIRMSWLLKLFSPLLKMTKTLIPKEGKNIAATVHFRSEADSNVFCFDRKFTFSDGIVYKFFSRMEPIGGNEVIEWTSSGIGWHCTYSYDGERIVLEHKGYCIKLFGKRISLPFTLIFGKAEAYEIAIDDNSFKMAMCIKHPIFGKLYSYSGRFEVVDE